MSVIVKVMEMPKTCHLCRMCVQVSNSDIDWHWECCLLCKKVERYATDRVPGCPLVPVPPHGRLIDADAVVAEIDSYIDNMEYSYPYLLREEQSQREHGMVFARDIVCDAPTIIPAEEAEI